MALDRSGIELELHRIKVLHSPFSVEEHKRTFINYLEVVISPDGDIEYAVPGHREKLMQILTDTKYGSLENVNNMCPREYWSDMLTWLCNETGYICVSDYAYVGKCTKAQANTLKLLAIEGLYKGEL